MFVLIRIFSLFLLLNQCGNTEKQSDENPIAQQEVNLPNKNNAVAQEELLSVTYQAVSRGVFYEVVVNEQQVKRSKERGGKEGKTKPCSKNEWTSIQSELKNIDLQKIKDLKTPSDNKNVDRSLHAKLIIAFSTESYTSVSFDHGNPPEQIASLVNTMLSLGESIE